ncbi:MAG: peptidoglycan-associated lipoprotein Pal [Methylomonas sp.]|jgi:peptidoglycan-associated lipoprotein
MKFKKINWLVMVLVAVLMTACSSNESQDAGTADATQDSDASTSGISDGSMSGSQFGSGSNSASRLGPEFSDPNNPLSKQIIYFELDSSQIRQDYLPVVAAHASYLTAHPNQHVILAGHCDERGSSEYNIALGEQRAKSVERVMRTQGVSPAQLEIVSYGEEKPAVAGHNESAWQMNRRVEVIYQ